MEEHEQMYSETTCKEQYYSQDQFLNTRELGENGNESITLQNHNERLETPYVGMLFETWEEARKYYEDYGRQEGFWIRIRSSSKTRAGVDEVTSKKFVCAHQGKYIPQNKEILGEKSNAKTKTRSCSTVKCGCKANMRIVLEKWSTKWKVSVFDNSHNHKVVTPAKRIKMRSNRHMPAAAKSLVETFRKENLPVGKVSSVFCGEYVGFDDRDCYNHLRNVRHRQLDVGDAQWVLNYFRKKQSENPQFFYAIQCDENDRATNFFWVDSRSRMAYRYFGDVVTFDTTYRTNKYDMPFAPFTGVNHHMQSIDFGCALLQDESETTFSWLFQTWLEAMGGRHPVSIITDQDLAMKGAISKVFPHTRHRLCIWHIKKKFGEKLSHVYFKKSKFKIEMKKCIWSTYKVEDFEEKWKTLIEKYGLKDNSWLDSIYNLRESWVPVYNRSTFFAGMNTTGRSESTNSKFDHLVTPTTNLKEFVVKFDDSLKRIKERESNEDYDNEHKFRIVKDDEFLLKHAAKVYTRNVYNKFKCELSQVNKYKVEEKEAQDGYNLYVVKRKFGEPEELVVKLNLQTYEGTCECKNFEFVGILCRHFLKVFVRLDVDIIPEHFILSRWRQEANKFRVTELEVLEKDGNAEESKTLRLGHMCQESTKLACIASCSQEDYLIYMEAMKDLSKKLNKDNVPSSAISEKVNDQPVGTDAPSILLLDPNISQTKGRKKDVNTSGRLKSSIELSSERKKRKCKACKKFAKHDSRNCPGIAKRQRTESSDDANAVEKEEVPLEE